jgi:hypothetical protein
VLREPGNGAVERDLNFPGAAFENRVLEWSRMVQGGCVMFNPSFIRSLGQATFETASSDIPGEIVVIVPLYNYEGFIIDCLNSLVKQTVNNLSVVVVDDGSADAGPDLAENFLKQHAGRFSSARLIRHERNQGPSMARNSGVVWSTEPLLFMLDADNLIRPPALARLKSAIEIDGADFAYSQLFVFGTETEIGHADIWDVDRLRYGNTIDAMAMIQRSALLRADGYQVVGDDHGLEDYDLWCRFYTLGLRGVFVPELLCEYRRHGMSRQDTTANINLDTLLPQIALRYPNIFNFEPWTPSIDEDLSISIPLKYLPTQGGTTPSVAVITHMFYAEMACEILDYIDNIRYSPDLYITTDSIAKKIQIERILSARERKAEIRVTPARGRDIGPRMLGFSDVYNDHEFVLLLHTKRSLHNPELRNWGKYLFETLVGSQGVVDSIFEIFTELPEVGVVAAQHFGPVRKYLGWGENFEYCRLLAARFGTNLKINGFLDYPSGSMLWARTAALRPFFDARLALEDFRPDYEGPQIDGSMSHAVERLFFVAAEKACYSWVKVAQPHLFEWRDTIKEMSSPAELRKFAAGQRRILA